MKFEIGTCAPMVLLGGLMLGVVPASADFVAAFSTMVRSPRNWCWHQRVLHGAANPSVTYIGSSDLYVSEQSGFFQLRRGL